MDSKIVSDENSANSGEAILNFIDAYNIEREKYRIEYLKSRKTHGYKIKSEFSEIIELIQKRKPDADVSGFILELSRLRTTKTFINKETAEYLTRQFEAFNYGIPDFVKNCIDEVEMRSSLIDKLFSNEKHQWKEKQIIEYKQTIDTQLNEETYNDENKKEWLQQKFKETIKSIKQIEQFIKNNYGYYIETFYLNSEFKATKENLNTLFFEGEKSKGTIQAFYDIHKILMRYVDNKNRLLILKELIKNQPPQKTEKKKENTLWFKTGLLFAKGEMEKYYSANGKAMRSDYTAGKIADEVDFPKGEKYILGTLQGYKTDKNIYNSRDKMLFILDHCENENIKPHQSFLEKLPPETI